MSSLQISHLNKSYGTTSVLRDIDVEIDTGDFLVLVGPSGCGKSTLLNMIAGLETISSGDIRIDGDIVNDVAPAQRDIAMVFQSYALYPNMNVSQNMSFGMEMRGIDKATREQAVENVAGILQIEHLLKRKPAQLSGGQRQRVAMGRALVRNPKIFLFDEPLSNLDAKLRVEMRSEIKRLHQRLQATIVYVTHDQIEAMSMATKIVVLNGGIIQQQGPPEEIYKNPANTFVASFMGSPPMNLIETTIRGDSPHALFTLRDQDDVVIPCPAASAGTNVIMGIRPESLTNMAVKAAKNKKLSFKAVLDIVEPTGADTYGFIQLNGKEIIIRLDPNAPAKPGDSVTIACNLDDVYWFDAESGVRI